MTQQPSNTIQYGRLRNARSWHLWSLLVVYMLLMTASLFLLAVPGGSVEWFAIPALCALMIAGLAPNCRWRWAGVVLTLIAIALMVQDHQAGQEYARRMARKFQPAPHHVTTSSPSADHGANTTHETPR